MKKILSALLALVLLATMVTSFAFAAEATYPHAKNFITALENSNIKYTYNGIDDDGDENIRVGFDDDDLNVDVRIFFNQNNTVSMRAWNVVDINCGLNYAYQVCNELNYAYKYVTFYVDTGDKSLTVSMDGILTEGADCGSACAEMLLRMLSIMDDARESILKLK